MYAVEVKNLSKTYKLYKHPSDRLKEIVLRKSYHEVFQPLKDLSFMLPRGGILGIIGDNGAGKSTLLKLLAGTLLPSSGSVKTHGRVAALLELGAGFHPELSGRENIYLNAMVLGLSEAEIREREADIIAFSELEDFIDRPIKNYSSGMYVRLAFSVAASVDPEILIIDEALSVGDQHFQKKCVNRMMEFKNSGKTILFCSHSMHMVQELCNEALWLKQGEMQAFGATKDVVGAYLSYQELREQGTLSADSDTSVAPSEHSPLTISDWQITDANGALITELHQFSDIRVTLNLRCTSPEPILAHVGVLLLRPDDQMVVVASSKEAGLPPLKLHGKHRIWVDFPRFPLNSGVYRFCALIADEFVLHLFDQVHSPLYAVVSKRPEYGLVWLPHTWHMPDSTTAVEVSSPLLE